MTSTLRKEQVLAALDAVIDPELHRSLVAAGMIQELQVDDGRVAFTLELTTPACPLRDTLRQAAEEAVRALPGVTEVTINLTARVRAGRGGEELLRNVRNVIAVASGKGGVGKSTVAANLAVALAQSGAKTGLLDLDIYGPSIPLLFDLHEQPEFDQEKKKLIPLVRYDVRLMSIGLLLEEGQAVIWRGPMVAGAVQQLLRDVEWDGLDYLVVDLPPGTGDAPLSLAQLVPLSGVVIVTTAQDAALTIATKAMRLFETMQVPIFGIIENIGTFVCPNCRQETQIFGRHGAAEEEAERLRVPFLGRIPLTPEIVVDSDRGIPSVIAHPDSSQAGAFRDVAGAVAAQASVAAVMRGSCNR